VNIALEDALDKGWGILAECFTQDETGFRSNLIKKYWPSEKNGDEEKKESGKTLEEPADDNVESEEKEVTKSDKTEESPEPAKEKKKGGKKASKAKKK
jgi:hypothetical protein